MRISARVDYAIRAAAELVTASGPGGVPVKGVVIADAQEISVKFLENIFVDLRRAGLVRSLRGSEGGYQLGLPAEQITIADIIRAVEGPLASIRDIRPDEVEYHGAAIHLKKVWIAVRASLRDVLEHVTLAELVAGNFPPQVLERLENPDAWRPHLASYGWVSPLAEQDVTFEPGSRA